MKTVASRLKWARTIAQLSQRRLSLLAGLSNRHVCSLEGGKLQGHMRSGTVEALSEVLGLKRIEWLAYGRGPRPSEKAISRAAARSELRFRMARARAAAEARRGRKAS